MAATKVLAIIPARGGSKGVPNKNMRLIAGKPLIAYTVEAAVSAGAFERIVVSSDDDAVLSWAAASGVEARRRDARLAADDSTIADVAAALAEELEWSGVVCVLQPTSPLRGAASITAALEAFEDTDDSLATVRREPHLYWRDRTGDLAAAQPLFAERLNRQYARHEVLLETGSIQLVRASVLTAQRKMAGRRHRLLELPYEESLDVDSHDDLQAVRRRLEKNRLIFRVTANRNVGSGHLYHCLRLAEELGDFEQSFLLVDCDPFVREMLDSKGYRWRSESSMVQDLEEMCENPSTTVVVNDVLDTSEREVLLQRASGLRVVNIEDLGPGALHADVVINALYPPKLAGPSHVRTGAKWATLRSEFAGLTPAAVEQVPSRVLLTFGGTDPGHFAERFTSAASRWFAPDVAIEVLQGPGAVRLTAIPDGVTVLEPGASVAEALRRADVVITSAGRTVFEAASTGTPVVVVAQNAREATHSHLTLESGVVFAGLGALVEDDYVMSFVARLMRDFDLRQELSSRLRSSIDHRGAERIAHVIRGVASGLSPSDEIL